MKTVLLVVLCVFLLGGLASADEVLVNKNVTRIVDKGQRDAPLGGGVDVVIYKPESTIDIKVGDIEEVTAEYRYDDANGEHSAYLVARVNVWNKIKGLFNKDEEE